MLGVGERVGNTAIDLMLVNLRLEGLGREELGRLAELVDLVSAHVEIPIPVNYPVFGRDAFRTGTGVHAAAVIKAKAKGEDWLADRIYSGVPASWFGRRQEIEIGHQSGLSNVRFWLAQRGYSTDESLVKAIFEAAKRESRLLSNDEVVTLVEQHTAQ